MDILPQTGKSLQKLGTYSKLYKYYQILVYGKTSWEENFSQLSPSRLMTKS